jgi:hypothetical protein
MVTYRPFPEGVVPRHAAAGERYVLVAVRRMRRGSEKCICPLCLSMKSPFCEKRNQSKMCKVPNEYLIGCEKRDQSKMCKVPNEYLIGCEKRDQSKMCKVPNECLIECGGWLVLISEKGERDPSTCRRVHWLTAQTPQPPTKFCDFFFQNAWKIQNSKKKTQISMLRSLIKNLNSLCCLYVVVVVKSWFWVVEWSRRLASECF